MAEEKTSCRICGGELEIVLDLGEIYPSDFLDAEVSVSAEPLALVRCAYCGFVQLKHTVNRDQMYREYWYKSSLNQSMLNALQDVVTETLSRANLGGPEDPHNVPIVVDIGANDGSMLAMFPGHCITVGFDPALNLREEAEERCGVFINDYFSQEAYIKKMGSEKASIITAIAMFYDLDDPHDFLIDVKCVLAPDGIFVIQMTDLVRMLKANAFDNICHEHIGYYSLDVLNWLLTEHGLKIFDIQFNDVNGGSVRVFVEHKETDIPYEKVQQALWDEQEYFAQFSDPILAFSDRVQEAMMAVAPYLMRARYNNTPIYGLGASTKGNTLLQYWELNEDFIQAIGEVNPEKFGRKTIGTNIPIIPEKQLLAKIEDPTIVLVLPWHFAEFFKEKLGKRFKDGLRLLFPLPKPVLVSKDGETYL